MKYILPIIVILLAASVVAQQLDEKCYAGCYDSCMENKAASVEYCVNTCKEQCTVVSKVIETARALPSREARTLNPDCEDACRERYSNNYPAELETCLQTCYLTCEEICEHNSEGSPEAIQDCYIQQCRHPRPPVLSCEDVCRRDYGKDERQFQTCMQKRCLVTAVMPRSEVAPREPEITTKIPKEELLQPTPGCREECQRSFERCTSGCGRPECPRPQEPEPQCETRCIQGFRQCISEISPDENDRQAATRECKQHALECFTGCLPLAPRGEVALPRAADTEPAPERGFLSRIWGSITGGQ